MTESLKSPESWAAKRAYGECASRSVQSLGRAIDDILRDYPYLEREGVLQALRYAAWLAEEREGVLPSA